jgi:putative component of membrane protein insertase Oxa1/YidC/SpoIIIJ protein YidD
VRGSRWTSRIPTFGVLALVVSMAVARGAAAADADDETPQLWEPADAMAFLLATPADAAHPDRDDVEAASRWNGALGDGVTRALFGTYHTVFSSQDLPVCAFSPSCSRFSQRAINRCGLLEGALLSLDRLLRDHPLAASFYPVDEGGKLLRDDPARYCLTAPR